VEKRSKNKNSEKIDLHLLPPKVVFLSFGRDYGSTWWTFVEVVTVSVTSHVTSFQPRSDPLFISELSASSSPEAVQNQRCSSPNDKS